MPAKPVDMVHQAEVLNTLKGRLQELLGPRWAVVQEPSMVTLFQQASFPPSRIEVKSWMGSMTVALIRDDDRTKTTQYIDKDHHPSSRPVRWGFQKYSATEATDRLVAAVLACPVPQIDGTKGTAGGCHTCPNQLSCLGSH